MDDMITQFVAITDSSSEKARQYLHISDNNLEQAIELFFNTGGIDLVDHTQTQPSAASSSQPPPVPPPQTRPGGSEENIIDLDSEDEIEITGDNPTQLPGPASIGGIGAPATPNHESDEAMARRLQEEMYGEAGLGGAAAATGIGDVDEDGYRAPIAPTRETLVGPDAYDDGANDPESMRAAVLEELNRREALRQQRHQGGRPGIFNQQESIWNNEGESSRGARRERLARATGGASAANSKSTLLAEMYRPPFELMSKLSWEDARTEGKEGQKWILVNVQDPSIFDCQVLNRDLWKHEGIRETIRGNFIFMQYSKDDMRGSQYMQYYFPNRDNQELYPHIAIVDPRTGEQVKVWSGPPVPKAGDFLMQLHEFLDRYSLSVTAKNPVAKRKPEPRKGVESMTEEEQLEMAMQASLAGRTGPAPIDNAEHDPDALTRSFGDISQEPPEHMSIDQAADVSALPAANGDTSAAPPAAPEPAAELSAFGSISSSNPHSEPAATAPNTTRIQFRHPTGRVVRRFELSDPVRRLYEWLKAEPLEGKAGVDFELVAMGKNLIDSLDQTVEEAGLKNGTVMVEFIESGGDEAPE